MGLRIRKALQIDPTSLAEDRDLEEKNVARFWLKSLGSASEEYESEFRKKLKYIQEVLKGSHDAVGLASSVKNRITDLSKTGIRIQAHLDFETMLRLTSQS